MSRRRSRIMDLAARAARQSSDEFPTGAILIRGKNIVSTGWNQGSKTHPTQFKMYPNRPGTGLHAEIHTLQGLRPYDVQGADLYICRLKATGAYGLSKPCDECLAILKSYMIRRVFFSNGSNGIAISRLI